MTSRRRALVAVLFILLFIFQSGAAAQPRVAFEDRFEGPVKPQWSANHPIVSTTPAGGLRFLGPFGPESVQLNLGELPEHQFLRVAIDLLVLRSWDGNVGGPGPDVFTILTDDDRVLTCTSFGWNEPQAFPGYFSVHTAPPATGAVQTDTLGFNQQSAHRDGTYHIECILPHRGAKLGLRLIAATNSGIGDEAWGIATARVMLEDVTAPDAGALSNAWQKIGEVDPTAAVAAVQTLITGGEATVTLLTDKLRNASIPSGIELLDPSHGQIRNPRSPADGKDPYAIDDEALRRTILAAHVLQIIGSDAAKDLSRQHQAPAAPRTVNITVKESSGGAPIAFHPLWAVANNEDLNASLITDFQGHAKLQVPTSTRNLISIQTAFSGYVPMMRSLRSPENADQLPQSVEFELERGQTIGGSVVDNTGQPIDGATVVLHVSRQAQDQALRLASGYTPIVTGKDGTWSYDLFPEKYDQLRMGIYHPRYPLPEGSFYAMNEPTAPISVLREGNYVQKLQKGVPIEGIVYGSDGRPLAGALVGLGDDRVASNVMPEQITDREGRFFLSGPPGQTLTITVKAKGYAPDIRQCPVGTEPMSIRFEMHEGYTLKGRIVDSQGKPIPGATIAMDRWRQRRTLQVRLYSDAEGNFFWKEAPPDVVMADVFIQGYADNREVPISPGAENVITLKSPTKVNGTVVDDQTGKRIDKFNMVTGIQFDIAQPMFWDRRSSSPEQATGKDGKFELTFTFPYPAMAVRIEADGYLPSNTPTFTLDGDTKTYEVRLKKGDGAKGTLVDSTGAPVANADIVLVLAGQQFSLNNGTIRPGRPSEAIGVRSGSDGSFTLPPQTETFNVIALHDKGYANVSYDDFKKNDGKITLQSWAKIDGVVMIAGKPAPNVHVMGQYPDEFMAMRDPTKPQIYQSLSAESDEQGRFHLDRVIPGTVRLGREVPQGNRMFTSSTELTITPKPGESMQVKLGADGQ